MKKDERLHQGIALVSALIFLAVLVVFVSTALLVSTSNQRLSGDNLRTYQAQLAAEAGMQRVIAETWFTSEEDPSEDFQLELSTFREQLDDVGIRAGEAQRNSYGFGDEMVFQDSFEDSSYRASVRRVDVSDRYTLLRLDVTGLTGVANNPVATRRISSDMHVQVPQVDTQSFAVLGNNANCLFCHTQISSLEAAYTSDGTAVNIVTLTTPEQRKNTLLDKERVKLAFLENLRTDRIKEMNSVVTGTIYTRGITNVVGQASTLRAVPLRKIDNQSTSLLSSEVAKPITELEAVNCASQCGKRHALFYKNYPESKVPDGDVPKTFPQLIPDTNQNHFTEDSEWQNTIAKEKSSGQLKGGAKRVVAATAQTVSTLSSSESAEGIKGNVILEGTVANPLILEGTVYVNGDVVINGTVTGDGKIIARGNVYVVGSINYACDDNSTDNAWRSSQTKTCNYSKPDTLPRLGIIAGKNILVGSYITPGTSAKGKPSDQLTRTDFSETSEEEVATWFVDGGMSLEPSQPLSYTMVQMALFNENEYRKAKSDSGYTPQFYTLREGGAVFRCNKGFSDTKETYCKTYEELTNISASAVVNTSDQEVLERATVLNTTPSNAWLAEDALSSELTLRSKWVENVETKPRNALHLDGLYYTPNAIFGNLPLASNTEGKLVINGSLAAADVALLAPGGLSINNDVRLAEMLELEQTNNVIQMISNYRLLELDAVIEYEAISQ
ncbi:MAG: hypothetical protein ACRCYY_20885 [Trueperaceae bacterium]